MEYGLTFTNVSTQCCSLCFLFCMPVQLSTTIGRCAKRGSLSKWDPYLEEVIWSLQSRNLLSEILIKQNII